MYYKPGLRTWCMSLMGCLWDPAILGVHMPNPPSEAMHQPGMRVRTWWPGEREVSAGLMSYVQDTHKKWSALTIVQYLIIVQQSIIGQQYIIVQQFIIGQQYIIGQELIIVQQYIIGQKLIIVQQCIIVQQLMVGAVGVSRPLGLMTCNAKRHLSFPCQLCHWWFFR